MTDPAKPKIEEAVARAILKRRVQADFQEVIAGHWLVDHDKEIARIAISAHLAALDAAGYAVVPKEPTDAMKQAAFGPIQHGGRGGPVTADFIRQEAALGTYRAMLAARPKPTKAPEGD